MHKKGPAENPRSLEFTGANEEIRTLDLRITNALLYQLSYIGNISLAKWILTYYRDSGKGIAIFVDVALIDDAETLEGQKGIDDLDALGFFADQLGEAAGGDDPRIAP